MALNNPPSELIIKTNDYYKNGNLKKVSIDGIVKEAYEYDDDGCLTNETVTGKYVKKKLKKLYKYVNKKAPVLTGIFDATVDEIGGLYDTIDQVSPSNIGAKVVGAITNPKQTVKNIKNTVNEVAKVVSHPVKTTKAVVNNVAKYVNDDIINGDAHTRSEFGTHAVIAVASFFIGGGEAKAASSVDKISLLTKVKNTPKELVKAVKTLPQQIITNENGSTKIFNSIFKSFDAGASEVKSAVTRQTGTYKELLDAGANDSHHIIQDAAMRDIPGYNRMKAPAIQLDGPAREIGTPHYNATQAQRSTIGGGTYGAERRIGYRSLREAGLSVDEAKATIRGADSYFMDELGLGLDSPTRMPGNRTRGR